MSMYFDTNCQKCGIALTHVMISTKFCPDCKPIADKERFQRAHAARMNDEERRAKHNEQKRKLYWSKREEVLKSRKEYAKANPDLIKEIRKRSREKARAKKEGMKPKPLPPMPKKQAETIRDTMSMLRDYARHSRTMAHRPELRTIMPAKLNMQECPRLHMRSTNLPCGQDMDICRGCPKCRTAQR